LSVDEFEKLIDKIILDSKSPKELMDKINESKTIDLEANFGTVCSKLKERNSSLFRQFLEQVILENKIDLVTNNIEDIGILYTFNLALKSNNDKLVEFINENFQKIVGLMYEKEYVTAQDIKQIIIDERFNKEDRVSMLHTMIRKSSVNGKMKLQGYITKVNGQLGHIEDYLADFLYISENKDMLDMDYFLIHLQEFEEDLDKVKLLQEINNNFSVLIHSFPEDKAFKINKFLDIIKEIEEELPQDSKEIQDLIININNSISSNFVSVLKKHKYDINLIELFRQYDIDNSKFKGIQNDIIEQLSGGDLLKYIQSAKENEGFDKEWDSHELIRQLFKNNEEIANDKTAQYTIIKLVEELLEHENVTVKDIEYVGSGAFSYNIKIGNFVLKLGEEVKVDDRKEIPHDKRILKPIIRQQYNQENVMGIPNIFLEVQNLVDAKWYDGLSEDEVKEQLYMVYSELRDRGIRWTDIKPENVGRLLRPNKENFEIETLNENGEQVKKEIKSDNYAIGFTGKEPDEILGPGELVIIDLDYIYDADDKISIPKISYYKEFEERYQREKAESKNIKTDDIKEIIAKEGYTREDLRTIEESGILSNKKDKSKGE